jgi:hypothetical protein
MVAPSASLPSSNLGMIFTQIQTPYQMPDRTGTVVVIDQLFDIDGM